MPIPEQKQALQRISAKEHIYQTLREWIVDGTMRPGENFHDSALAEHFEVSRTPVREALLLLATQNFVEVIPSCGTRVSQINREDALAVYEALAVLSGQATKLACEKQNVGDLEQLRALNRDFAAGVKSSADWKQMYWLDLDFHRYIFQMAANSYLADYFGQLVNHAYRYENVYFSTGIDKSSSVIEHEQIISAIQAQDRVACVQAGEDNWLGFYNSRLKNML